MSQIWAATGAWYYTQDHVRTFSGGTEATAFNARAVAAIERAGSHVIRPEGENPPYEVSFTTELNAETCWSKVYNDPSYTVRWIRSAYPITIPKQPTAHPRKPSATTNAAYRSRPR